MASWISSLKIVWGEVECGGRGKTTPTSNSQFNTWEQLGSFSLKGRDNENDGLVLPFNPHINIQILLTDLHTFPYCFSLENF